jgi:hypothetical protein
MQEINIFLFITDIRPGVFVCARESDDTIEEKKYARYLKRMG